VNVAIFLTYDYSIKTWKESGTLERELKLYKTINKKYGTKFTFVSFGGFDDKKILENEKNLKVLPVYTIMKYRNSKILRFIYSFLIPFKLKKNLKNIDIIHQHQLLGSWVSYLYSKIIKKPLLVRTGYDMYLFAKSENKQLLKIYLYKILTKLTIKYSEIFTVTSRTDYEHINNVYKGHISKVKIRPNWIEVDKPLALESRYQNRILSVGRIVYQKNFQLLINEFKDTKNELIIDIVGQGNMEKELIELAKKNNVKINLVGNINYSELIELYKKYIFYISTSLYEGNPKTLLEAMASGCVVIASDIPNHKELITDGENGFIFDLNSPNLKNKYKKLITDRELINQISKNTISSINETNNILYIADKTYSDYDYLSSL
tara:strand:- start:682 stop:1812 length:1131 start_codon:yes stop_codon:yes gene_type:complete